MVNKKTYFAEGIKAGFKLALDCVNSYWDYGECGNCYYEHIELPNAEEPSQDDIDEAWSDYCEYWKQKAIERVQDGDEYE